MNRITSFILMILVSGAMITGCKKDNNPKLPDGLNKASLPLVKADAGSSTSITDVNTFQGKFSVGLYFATDEAPKKMDVVVAMKKDYTKVKVFKADVTAYPTSLTVTAQQLATLFGKTAADLKPGDFFEIGVNVYMNSGLMVPIFTTGGIRPYGPDATSYPGASIKVTYKVE